MGRKAAYTEKKKSGPGKKSKKQSEPIFDDFLPKEDKILSSHQKKRAIKRATKAEKNARKEIKLNETQKSIQNQQNAKQKKSSEKQEKALFMSDDEDDDGEDFFAASSDEDDDNSPPKLWLKPDSSEEENSDAEEEEEDSNIDADSDQDLDSDEEMEETNEPGNDMSDNSMPDDDMSDDSMPDDDMSDSDEEVNPAVARLAEKLHKAKTSQLEISLSRPTTNVEAAIPVPSLDEILQETEEKADMSKVQHRILDVLTILNNFNKLHDPTRSRADYMRILEHDICLYYSYNDFLVKKFLEMLPADQIEDFFEANERQKPTTLRVNTLKLGATQATTSRITNHLLTTLIGKGINVNKIDWSTVGLSVVNSSIPLGATPEYLDGRYMLQGASSFLPVMALKPKPNEVILDMCAAPGGKTTHLATYMQNTGCIFSNDANKNRLSGLQGNLMRMGVQNAITVNMNGTEFGRLMPTRFDRVLCDAPCSGTGVIAKDPRVKFSKSEEDIKKCSKLQKELILSAIDSCNAKSKDGGYIVYSTCSLLVEENEAVVNYALERRNVTCISTGLPGSLGKPGFKSFRGQHFHVDLANSRRIYPHHHNMDGFFVALLKKTSNEIEEKYKVKPPTEKKSVLKKREEKLKKRKEVQEQAKIENEKQNAEKVKIGKKKNKKPEIKSHENAVNGHQNNKNYKGKNQQKTNKERSPKKFDKNHIAKKFQKSLEAKKQNGKASPKKKQQHSTQQASKKSFGAKMSNGKPTPKEKQQHSTQQASKKSLEAKKQNGKASPKKKQQHSTQQASKKSFGAKMSNGKLTPKEKHQLSPQKASKKPFEVERANAKPTPKNKQQPSSESQVSKKQKIAELLEKPFASLRTPKGPKFNSNKNKNKKALKRKPH